MAEMADSIPEKPSVLVVGGLGYIGRYIAKYLHESQVASRVRLVDRRLPELALLPPEFVEACSSSVFMQADASRESSMPKIFEHPDGPDRTWDYVFNVGGESSWSQTAEIYRLRDAQLSLTLAKEAAKRGIKAYVEVSTGTVYQGDRKPSSETDKIKPWQLMGQIKLEVEEELSKMAGLNLVILRMPHVYGYYLTGIVAKPLCLARIYQASGKKLEWLWSSDLKMNTVHVEDVARAFWVAAEWRTKNSSLDLPIEHKKSSKPPVGPIPGTPVFNIVDHSETSQGSLAKFASDHFNVRTGFHGTIISSFAKLNMDYVVNELNEEHLGPWAELCEKKGITTHIPISPFLEKELLKDKDLSLDGSLFERTTGFKYQYEKLTYPLIEEMIKSYERMRWWP